MQFFSFDMDSLKDEGEISFPEEWGYCKNFSCSPNGKSWYFKSPEELFIFSVNDEFEIKVTCVVKNVESVQWIGNSLLIKVERKDPPNYLTDCQLIFFPDPSKNQSILILTSDQATTEKVNLDCNFFSSSVEGNVAICGDENVMIFPLATLMPEHQERRDQLESVLQEPSSETYVPTPLVKVMDEYSMGTVENNDPSVVTKACLAFQFKSYLEKQVDKSQIDKDRGVGDHKLFSPGDKKTSEYNFIYSLKSSLRGNVNYREKLDSLVAQFQQFGINRKELTPEASQILDTVTLLAERQQAQLNPIDAKKLGP